MRPLTPVVNQQALDRKRELDIKEREVAAKESELKRSRWMNPTVIGLFAAALGLISSVIVARVNNANTQEVQRLQAESTLTLEAIKTGAGNTDGACKNLTFFVGLELIRDLHGKIREQCKGTPPGPPSLPTGEVSGGDPIGDVEPKLVGTWEIASGDSSSSEMTLLELHSDGTYRKTLNASSKDRAGFSNSYGGTHTGRWKSRGAIVYLSGDRYWPDYLQDLSKAKKRN